MIVFGNSLRARFFGDKLSIKKKLREVRMPWKASSVMEERLLFVARLLDGETMTDVCRDFGISRKTGYKIFDRYKEHGLEALTDRSRRPVRNANQLPQRLESLMGAISK
jgi:transposase-like protein